MKIYLGLLAGSFPHETRLFSGVDGKLIDLGLAYSAHLAQIPGDHASAYDLAAYYFPPTIAEFLERGEHGLQVSGRSRFLRTQNRRRRSPRARRRKSCLRSNGNPNIAAVTAAGKKFRHRLFRPSPR